MTRARAVLWTAAEQVEVTEVEVRSPGPGEILVQVEYSLVSPGTEREWLTSDLGHVVLGTTFPFVPGYSPAGRVVAIGAGVEGWAVGDPIVGNPTTGAHASHVVVPAALAFHVPEGVPLRAAVAFNIGMTAVHTVRLADVEAGDSLSIVGQGPIGAFATQVARARGMNPIVCYELDQQRRERSLQLGATHTRDPRRTGEVEDLLRQLGGGTRATIDLSASPAGIDTALHATAPLGTVVFSTAMNAPVTLDYGELFLKGLTVKGAFVMARMAESNADVVEFLRLLSTGEVVVPQDHDELYAPEQAPELYRRVVSGDRGLSAPVFTWA